MAKHLLINLETKAITGVDTDIVSYSIVSCDETGPKTEIQGFGFNPTKLNKEERKSFKEAANELINIHDRQTLDEEVKEFENGFRAAFSLPPLEYYKPSYEGTKRMAKIISLSSYGKLGDVSPYCKADVDLICNTLKQSKPSLDKIYINPDKEIVTAKKDNDEIIKIQCGHGDEFDPYIGAALAYCYKQFGSKAAFRKAVDKITPKPKKKVKKDPMLEAWSKGETYCADDKPVLTHNQFHADYDIIKQDSYKVGDVVKIRDDLHESKCDYNIYCNPDMVKHAGKIFTISDKRYDVDGITLDGGTLYTLPGTCDLLYRDDGSWNWTADMFEGKVVPKK